MREIGGDAEQRDWLARWWQVSAGRSHRREGGDFAKIVLWLGGKLLAPHADADRVTKFLGNRTTSTTLRC